MLQDIAILTVGQAISKDLGIKLKNVIAGRNGVIRIAPLAIGLPPSEIYAGIGTA